MGHLPLVGLTCRLSVRRAYRSHAPPAIVSGAPSQWVGAPEVVRIRGCKGSRKMKGDDVGGRRGLALCHGLFARNLLLYLNFWVVDLLG